MRSKYSGFSKSIIYSPSNSFFSSSMILPSNFRQLHAVSDPLKIEELIKHKERMIQVMRNKFPNVMEGTFKHGGQMAYRLCSLSPEEMVAKGGFKTLSKLYISNTGSGDNSGSICFSLLPAVTTIFDENIPRATKRYIYACLLEGVFFAPGGKFRQIIIPGALPIPSLWMAKEVLSITQDRQAVLGPMIVGQISKRIGR